ncbi:MULTISPECIES: glutaredoxin [Streptomyces]|uniref:glutaredoxin n=1 Tax=Streptomyces TaxID=1883 RepID=UPI00163C9281|nr:MULTISPECIES: glutaredoxin [Streptomyces]MBC2878098.1 glutaredoxin [Streptomyces sp. TYQ1024]UBI40044.1 glutaredoxin [Streptomyces mobaraensis]UKW32624.1 glutaredoxin [Streptomyces sp. TYQ1024]
MTDVTAGTKDLISAHKVVIFSKSWCPHSTKAKKLLSERVPEEDLAIVELDEREDGDEIQDELHKMTKQRTVPNIFINQAHIGGNDDLQKLHQSGKLATLLNA